jgi:hypothetical protein
MGTIKDRNGTYYVQRKVPERLQEAVARVLNAGETRRVFLKKSLGTKNTREANAAAPHVLAEFNRIIAEAEALLKERPVLTTLTDTQIKRMAESYYATLLANDDEERREGTGSEPLFQSVAKQLEAAGIEYNTPFNVGSVPEIYNMRMGIAEIPFCIASSEWRFSAESCRTVRQAQGDRYKTYEITLNGSRASA